MKTPSTLTATLIGASLLALRNRVAAYPGMLFFIYLIFNGVERFWIEKIRVNPEYTNLGVTYTQAEFISVVLFLIGLAGVVVLWRRTGKKNS